MTKEQIKRDQTLRALNRCVTDVYKGKSSNERMTKKFSRYLAEIKSEGGYDK